MKIRGAALAACVIALLSHHDLSAGQVYYDVTARYSCDGVTNANTQAKVVTPSRHSDDGLNRTVFLSSIASSSATYTANVPTGYFLAEWNLSCCDPRYKTTDVLEADNPLSLTYAQLNLGTWQSALYLDAVFKSLTYTLHYERNGGSGKLPADITANYHAEVTLSQGKGLECPGYSFAGWNTEKDGTGLSFETGETVTGDDLGITENGQAITLYAQWAGDQYTLSLNPKPGDLPEEPCKIVVANGAKYPELPVPTRWGYKFWRWVDGNAKIIDTGETFTYTGDKSLQLFADWKACTYELSFDKNGGKGEMLSQNVTTGQKTTLRKNTFTREDYDFKGWHTNKQAIAELLDDEAYGEFDLSSDGSSVKLYAIWAAHPYTLNYEANGGEGKMFEQKCSAGSDLTLRKNAFTREWHDFLGWDLDKTVKTPPAYADGATISGGLYAYAEDDKVSLYAIWKAWRYEIGFEKNDRGIYRVSGSQAALGSKVHDEPFALPACTYQNDNAFFVGWSTNANARAGDSDCWKAGTLVSNLVDRGTCTLYPIWSVGALSEAVGLVNGILETKIYPDKDWTTEMLQDSTNGWFAAGPSCLRSAKKEDRALSDPNVVSLLRFRVRGAGSLIFSWKALGSISQGGWVSDQTNDVYSVSTNGYEYLLLPTEMNQFENVNWKTNRVDILQGEDAITNVIWSATYKPTDPSPSYALYLTNIVWTPAAYTCTVSFEPNGGSSVLDQQVSSGGTVTRPDDPTREGWIFDGWYSDAGLNALYDFAAKVASDRTLYAKWKAIPVYTITFESNGGSAVPSQQILEGGKVTRPDDPTRADYDFAGWCRDAELSEDYDFATPVTSDMTLYAKWTAQPGPTPPPPPPIVKSYTIDFAKNYATATGVTAPLADCQWDVEYVLPACGFSTSEADFLGWDLNDAAVVPTWQPGNLVSNLVESGTVTVHAVWKAHAYVVSFDANDETATGEMEDQPFTCGVAAALSRNAYACAGKSFKGWSRDASSGIVAFADGETVRNLTLTDGATVTLYAVWEDIVYNVGTIGELYSCSVADLGVDVPAKTTLTAEGLPAGLKLKSTASGYYVEGVPTEARSSASSLVYFKIGTSLQGCALDITSATASSMSAKLNVALEATPVTMLWPAVADGEWTFSGWPTGLSYAKTDVKGKAAAGELYGKPTKAGVFTVTATRRVKSDVTGSSYSEKRYARFVVMPNGETDIWRTSTVGESVQFSLFDEFPRCKSVSGLPTGLSYAKSAVLGKAAAGDVYGKPTKAGSFVMIVTDTDGAKNYRLWEVLAAQGGTAVIDFGSLPTVGGVTTASAGVSVAWPVVVTAGATLSAPGLPTGLKLAKSASGYIISGAPTKAGNFVVKLTVKCNGVTTVQYVGMTIEALPAAAVGTFFGVASTGVGCWGQAQLTLTSAGKVSGSFYVAGARISFSARALTACEDDAYLVDVTYAYAKVSRVSRLRLCEASDDCGFEAWCVELASPDDVLLSFDAGADVIKREFKTLPKAVAATYALTGDMLTENEYLTAKVTTAGAVRVAGKLADKDGKLVAVSLSTKLVLASRLAGGNLFDCPVTIYKTISRKDPVALNARFTLAFPDGATSVTQVKISPLVSLDSPE